MLYWLLQSTTAHPALERGEPPPVVLSTQESQELASFTVPQRRRDWLLGRWTAKRLLQQIVAQRCGFEVPANAIVIGTDGDGAPLTSFREPLTGREFSLSISHSQGYALCAVVTQGGVPIGVDIEAIERRDTAFVTTFFNPEEQALLRPQLHDMHVTAIWSGKEAALKAIRRGLRADPLQVSCLVKPVAAQPQDWIPFRIAWRERPASPTMLPELTGWWQALGDFVLTVAAPA